jgi:hypothetical protein
MAWARLRFDVQAAVNRARSLGEIRRNPAAHFQEVAAAADAAIRNQPVDLSAEGGPLAWV